MQSVKHLLSSYCVPGSVVDPGNTEVTRQEVQSWMIDHSWLLRPDEEEGWTEEDLEGVFITRQARGDGSPKNHGSTGDGEKRSGSAYVLRVKPDGFPEAWKVGVREGETSRVAPRLTA